MNLGGFFERRGDLDGARQLYREAIAARRELRAAYEALARLEERAGQLDEAARVWRALAAISADPTAARAEIARLEALAVEARGAASAPR